MLLIFDDELREFINRNLEGVVFENSAMALYELEDAEFLKIRPKRASRRRPLKTEAPAAGSVAKEEKLPREEDVQLCASESALPREPETLAGAFPKDMEAELKKQIAERSDESFSGMLLRLIDEAGMTDAQCYNRANLNRSHFNRIKNDPNYRVQKNTAIALGLALRLPREKFDELLSRAGYSLSKASVSDLIIEFFLGRGVYDIMTVNRYLYEYDQPILGAGVR